MARKWYNKSAVKCPYYDGERDHCIVCEGLIKGTRISNWFKNKEEKKEFQVNSGCYTYPNNCIISAAHDRKNHQK